jgi:sugar lactone lactonase YvrE
MAPLLTRTTPIGGHVSGLTYLGDQLFVLRRCRNEVEVYDVSTFEQRRGLKVPGLCAFPKGLAACGANNCLYVLDNMHCLVYRVGLESNNNVTNWPVAYYPRGISMTNNHNVLLLCREEHKLYEYTTRGDIAREIGLQPDMVYLTDAVQLPCGQFVVSHRGFRTSPSHCVSLVGMDGQVVRSYGGSHGSVHQEFINPEGLAVDRNGCILVADYYNNRIVLVDSSLTRSMALPISAKEGFDGHPSKVFFDESRGRLYVVEWFSGHLSVFDNVGSLQNYFNE